MTVPATSRIAWLKLANDPVRQLREELPSTIRTASEDELGSVLCGAACFIAAAGHRDGASGVLSLIDEFGFVPRGSTAARDAAVTVAATLECSQEWSREVTIRPRTADYWTIEQWAGELPRTPIESLEGVDLLRRGLAAAREGDDATAQSALERFAGSGAPRPWEWTKAMMVLIDILLRRGRDHEAAARVIELVDKNRNLGDVLGDERLAALVLNAGVLAGIWGLRADDLAAIAGDVICATHARAAAPFSRTVPRSADAWRVLVDRWEHGSSAWLATAGHAEAGPADGPMRRSGATEAALGDAERRLGMRLPPSYRAFLATSDGFRICSADLQAPLLGVSEIDWFREKERQWVEIWTDETDDGLEISDAEYLIYGVGQDEGSLRRAYLWEVLQISDVDDGMVWLLNPAVQTPDGEWEAWEFANSKAGADRYPSFAEMIAGVIEDLEDPG